MRTAQRTAPRTTARTSPAGAAPRDNRYSTSWSDATGSHVEGPFPDGFAAVEAARARASAAATSVAVLRPDQTVFMIVRPGEA